MNCTITRTYEFAAAHFLPNTPPEHKCHRMHGHNYTVVVACEGPITADGWVCDYGDIDAAARPLIAQLDHRCINDVIDGPGTAEALTVWLWGQLAPALGGLLAWVDVRENARSSAVYRGRPVDFPDTPRRPCSSAGGADLKSNLADLAGDLGEALGDVAATKRAILAWENAARDRWAACAWFLGETRALLALAGHVGNDSEFGSRVALLGADVVRVSDGEADLSILPVEGDHRG